MVLATNLKFNYRRAWYVPLQSNTYLHQPSCQQPSCERSCGPSAGKHVTYRQYAAAWDRAYTDADRAERGYVEEEVKSKSKPAPSCGTGSGTIQGAYLEDAVPQAKEEGQEGGQRPGPSRPALRPPHVGRRGRVAGMDRLFFPLAGVIRRRRAGLRPTRPRGA
ncbi:hypothetical protein THAOC_04046, partial [Thalassiosira oceanica]